MLDGNDLKSVRKNAGISQTDMAKKLDCDRRTIINYEQGVCEPKASQLFRWLSVCKIDLKPLASQLQHFKESIFVLFALPFISPEIVSAGYVGVIALCVLYGLFRKSVNITHMAIMFCVIYTFEYIITTLITSELKSLGASKYVIANSHFTFQICTSILALFVFKNRVRISLYILESTKVTETFFDNMATWIYVYHTFIAVLLAIEYTIDHKYNIKHLSFIYEHYEKFADAAMILAIWLLITMIICHEKELKNGNSQC
ncbi:helix-turn-helix domain-containing protein [Pseudoalteromonas aurantia]|uniref:HTH cro/C1-type domain-containing protein n=1 Tax=Pseudoalteromonas aurantia TaxID=43654 RepID=A0A5S3UWU3_9GAMM|nr:helix-turn-helix transcriptional regulator [Pseudoalteromonas aurantia]TMO61225.1 hypothetical protein CWC19_20985 [Pseudoalteromonas aurantia]